MNTRCSLDAKHLAAIFGCRSACRARAATYNDIFISPSGLFHVERTGNGYSSQLTGSVKAHIDNFYYGEVGSAYTWLSGGNRLALRDRSKTVVVDTRASKISTISDQLFYAGQTKHGDLTLKGNWPDLELDKPTVLSLFVGEKYLRKLHVCEAIVAVDPGSDAVVYGTLDRSNGFVKYEWAKSIAAGEKRVTITREMSDIVVPGFLSSRNAESNEYLIGLGHDRWEGMSLYRLRGQKVVRVRSAKSLSHKPFSCGSKNCDFQTSSPLFDSWQMPLQVKDRIFFFCESVVFDYNANQIHSLGSLILSWANDSSKKQIQVLIGADQSVTLSYKTSR